MANVRNGNTWHVDSSSSSGEASSFISDKGLRIIGVLITPSASGDILKIYDKAASDNAAGALKLVVKGEANVSTFLPVPPVFCPNGIWVEVTGTLTATIIGAAAVAAGN